MTEDFNKFDWNRLPEVRQLTGKTAAVAAEMFNRAYVDGTGIYGSREAMAADLGTTVKTIGRARSKLTSLGLIAQVHRGSGYTGKSSEYRLTMPSRGAIAADPVPQDKPAGQSNKDIASPQVTPIRTFSDVPNDQDTPSDVPFEGDSPIGTNRRSDQWGHPVSAGHSNRDIFVPPIDPRDSPIGNLVEEEEIGGTSEMVPLTEDEKEEILAELRISEDDSIESQLESDSWINQLAEEHMSRQPEEAASWWDTEGDPTTEGEQMTNDPFGSPPTYDPTPFGSVPQQQPQCKCGGSWQWFNRWMCDSEEFHLQQHPKRCPRDHSEDPFCPCQSSN